MRPVRTLLYFSRLADDLEMIAQAWNPTVPAVYVFRYETHILDADYGNRHTDAHSRRHRHLRA